MSEKFEPITDPYYSDFENKKQSKPTEEFESEIDFSQEPSTILMIHPYLTSRGEAWRGPKAALDFLRKAYRQTKDEQEKNWIKKMAELIKGEKTAEAVEPKKEKPATIEQCRRWLGLMAGDKAVQAADYQRQGDLEMAAEFEEQEKNIKDLISKIESKNWQSVDIKNPDAPINMCLGETADSLEFYKNQGRQDKAKETEKKLEALERIKDLIKINQNQ